MDIPPKVVTVFGLGAVELWAAIPAGFALGLHPVATGIASTLGASGRRGHARSHRGRLPELVGARLPGLADPTRVRILELLAEQPRRVSELQADLGLAQGRVSSHLACLRWCGYVVGTVDGRFNRYQLVDPRVREIIAAAESIVRENEERLTSRLVLGTEGRGSAPLDPACTGIRSPQSWSRWWRSLAASAYRSSRRSGWAPRSWSLASASRSPSSRSGSLGSQCGATGWVDAYDSTTGTSRYERWVGERPVLP